MRGHRTDRERIALPLDAAQLGDAAQVDDCLGTGQALLEAAIYDKQGQLLTASYMDYCMPRAGDLPSFQIAMTSTPCPSNPLGIKGCGEAGAIAAPAAVINAITDALGHEQIAMPATPLAVWRAVQQAPTKLAAE